jgi:hypothetical protein
MVAPWFAAPEPGEGAPRGILAAFPLSSMAIFVGPHLLTAGRVLLLPFVLCACPALHQMRIRHCKHLFRKVVHRGASLEFLATNESLVHIPRWRNRWEPFARYLSSFYEAVVVEVYQLLSQSPGSKKPQPCKASPAPGHSGGGP